MILPQLHNYSRRTGIKWPEMTFLAEAMGDKFSNFTVTTLKSYYVSLVQERALENITPTDVDNWQEELVQLSKKIMDSGEIEVREQIIVDEDYNVLVILDEKEVNDSIMDKALHLFETATIPGNTILGEFKTFTSKEVDMENNNANKNNNR